jgi:hypothetical protein
LSQSSKAIALVFLTLAAAPACSGDVLQDRTPDAAGGGGAGGGGGRGVGGAGGGGEACRDGSESIDVALVTADGERHECFSGPQDEVTLEGQIAAQSGATWQIDTCPPDADCPPSLNELSVKTAGLSLDIPIGTFVRVSFRIQQSAGTCTVGLLVSNLPTWRGAANPTASDEAPWLDNGGPGSPFAVKTSTRCTIDLGDQPPCAGAQEIYDLSFSLAADPSVSVGPVRSGESVPWVVPSGAAAGSYTARTLQATSAHCEQIGTLQYFIARAAGR